MIIYKIINYIKYGNRQKVGHLRKEVMEEIIPCSCCGKLIKYGDGYDGWECDDVLCQKCFDDAFHNSFQDE